MKSARALFLVIFEYFVRFVRTPISPEFSRLERRISHKAHKDRKSHAKGPAKETAFSTNYSHPPRLYGFVPPVDTSL
jgi:hypothetical protein